MSKKIIFLSVAVLGTLTLLGVGCTKKTSPSTSLVIPPSISVQSQSLGADNELVINKASIDNDGWIAIHQKEDGQVGKIIGYASLFRGVATKIKINVDRANISPSLFAVLHHDRGQKGVFEFPDTDGPVIINQQVIMEEFNISNYKNIAKEPRQTSTSLRKEFVITAKQWSFSPSVIKVKKGDTIVLKLSSADVEHGIVIADFGINTKFKPGEIKVVEFVADKTGTFEFICNVRCGVGHMGMKGMIIVE
jgi:cytochrome c oxidase subunit 2